MSSHTNDPDFRYSNDNRTSSASYSAYPSQGEPPPGVKKGETSYYPNDNGGFYANSNRLNFTNSDSQYPNSNYEPGSAPALYSTSSLEFNKADSDFLEIGDISSIAGNKEELSLSLWFKLTGSLSEYHGVLGSQANKIGEIYYNHPMQNFSITTLSNTNNTLSVSGPSSQAPIVQNRWFHFAMTFSKRSATSGRNMAYLHDTSTLTASISSRTDADTQTDANLFNGLSLGVNRRWANYGSIIIDEFALFPYELTAGQIRNIIEGQSNGAAFLPNNGRILKPGDLSTFNPIGWWRMGEDDGPISSIVTDLGNNNHGTINGATFSNDTPS